MLELASIFVDIDGVLNNGITGLGEIESPYAEQLDRIVAESSPLYMILISNWRKHRDMRDRARARFVIHDYTPTLPRNTLRGYEVQDWLDRHPDFSQSRYAILDDEPAFLPGQPFFHTPHGLTRDVADAVIAHLRATAS